MEIIRLSGYDIPEKVSIASRYLIPKSLEEAGITNTHVDEYTRAVLKSYNVQDKVKVIFTDSVLEVGHFNL